MPSTQLARSSIPVPSSGFAGRGSKVPTPRRTSLVLILLGCTLVLGLGSGLARAATPVTLVVCAPGYPGSTAEAAPAMDAFAVAVATAAGWQPRELTAVYFETEKGGLDRLAAGDAALALLPLPFWLQHHAASRLEPVAQAIQQGGESAEPWTLVAATGAVKSPSGLAGYELVSLAGLVPRFVRGPALGAWGELPADTRITFSGAVLSALRRAANGEKVALLLDRAQAAALPTLPFAAKLEVVTRSKPLPVSVLSVVGSRLPAARRAALLKGLMTVANTPTGAQALAGIRMSGFVPADLPLLTETRAAFDRARE
jgi:hypothetical protein